MHGADVAVPSAWIIAFARASAFAATVPIADGRSTPPVVRAALAIALVPAIVGSAPPANTATGPLLPVCVGELAIGAAFGLSASIVASAARAAGALVDAALSARPSTGASAFGTSDGPFGRVYALGFAWLFLASGAMTHLCERFTAASAAFPTGVHAANAVVLVRACTGAALSLAAPAIAGQCIATIVAGAAARAAPRINGLFLASPLSICLTLAGTAFGVGRILSGLARLAQAAATVKPL